MTTVYRYQNPERENRGLGFLGFMEGPAATAPNKVKMRRFAFREESGDIRVLQRPLRNTVFRNRLAAQGAVS